MLHDISSLDLLCTPLRVSVTKYSSMNVIRHWFVNTSFAVYCASSSADMFIANPLFNKCRCHNSLIIGLLCSLFTKNTI